MTSKYNPHCFSFFLLYFPHLLRACSRYVNRGARAQKSYIYGGYFVRSMKIEINLIVSIIFCFCGSEQGNPVTTHYYPSKKIGSRTRNYVCLFIQNPKAFMKYIMWSDLARSTLITGWIFARASFARPTKIMVGIWSRG